MQNFDLFGLQRMGMPSCINGMWCVPARIWPQMEAEIEALSTAGKCLAECSARAATSEAISQAEGYAAQTIFEKYLKVSRKLASYAVETLGVASYAAAVPSFAACLADCTKTVCEL